MRQWEGLNHPAATFAEHHVRRREIRDRNVLQHPVLGSLAAELNAVLALKKGDASRARGLLQPERYARHSFFRYGGTGS